MPSSSLSMASVTILILDRYRSSTGLPALVPGVFLSSFLPLPCVRLSLLSFPTPDFLDCPHLWFSSLLSCTSAAMVFWYGLCFPPKGSVPFSPASPSLLSPSLRLVISTSVLLPSPRPQTIQLFPVHLSDSGSTSPTLRNRLLWPAGLPKRAHTTPPELRVNRASDGK